MVSLDSDQTEFTFATEEYPSNALRVLRFTGRERISGPFSFEISLVSSHLEANLDAVVGQPALLTLRGRHGERHVHGIVESFEQLGVGRKLAHYTARLVPTIALLEYTRRSRIFQQQSVPEIVAAVLETAGIPADLLKQTLNATYGKRDYCVQYQESDLAFLSRLLEEEGIFYFFEHSREKDVLVLGDGEHAIEPLPTFSSITFRDESRAAVLEEECLSRFQVASSVRPGKVSLRDYRFKQPSVDMNSSASTPDFPRLETYYYPGEYVEPKVGDGLAKVRLEELQVDRYRYRGEGNCRALTPGYSFDLELHPREDLNRSYLVVEVEHRGTASQALLEEQGAGQVEDRSYNSHLVCVQATRAYRPARETPRPVVLGLQTAVVVGPEGEEIYTDSFGRVKVQFHWDRNGHRDAQSSCWIRASQPWGGAGWGALFLPRIGQEVLVQFLEGDPDRPVIVGRVYNGENPVPYALPELQTRSTIRTHSSPATGGYNELRFEDRAGEEEVHLRGEKDWSIEVLNDKHQLIGHNETAFVGFDRSRRVGNDERVTVGGNEAVTVDGSSTEDVGAEKVITAGARLTLVCGAASLTLLPDGTVTLGGRAIDFAGSASFNVAAPVVALSGSGTASLSGGTTTVSGSGTTAINGGSSVTVTGGIIKLNC